jgi:hypothetical protein
MGVLIVYSVIWIFLISAIFFAWFFYHQARNKERLILIEKGENPEAIFKKQKFRFSFPWLKLGNVILGLSLGFGLISIYFMKANDHELFQGFFITFIIGMSLGIPMIVNHILQTKKAEE